MGLGTHGGGVGVTRFLAAQGAIVTVTDRADADKLRNSLEAIGSLPLAALHLGHHQADDFTTAELVVVNPAVRYDDPWVALARRRGARITSEIELLLERCPSPVIGVTGSNGKSTTVTLLAGMLRAAGQRVWLGGNLGDSLLADLPQMTPEDVVLLELSSFQLHWLKPQPHRFALGLVTNCTPNHLDWHPDFAHYVQAKHRLIETSQQIVMDPALPVLSQWAQSLGDRLLPLLPDCQLPSLAFPGPHNRHNARLAATAAIHHGCSLESVHTALNEFTPLPHRMEHVTVIEGRIFYDDSKSTTPEATLAALNALTMPIWLLVGGVDKGADWEQFFTQLPSQIRGVVAFGQCGPRLHQICRAQQPQRDALLATDLRTAIERLWPNTLTGDAILLSPGCASFDQYADYVARAADFRRIAAALRANHRADTTTAR